jgi:hypothetical protein
MQPRENALIRARVARPPDLTTKAPAPVRLTAVRAVARPLRAVPVARPGRVARFHDWRRRHYAADQLMRVAAILIGGALGLAIATRLLFWALAALLGPILAVLAGIVGIAVGLAILFALASVLSDDDGHKGGWGFHYSRCKR